MAKKINVSAIIQARMTSTRLPGKVLMTLKRKPMLLHIVERLNHAKLIDQVILALPDTKPNDVLEKFAAKNRINYHRGSEENVLARFYSAAKENNSEVIVRITADNPLIDPEIVDAVVKSHLASKADYSRTHHGKEGRLLPLGLGVEVFNFASLEKAHNEAPEPWHKEHVTPYFYENPDIFKINNVATPMNLKNPELRLTVDTEEDFELMNKIYERLYRKGEIFRAKEVMDFIERRPELKKINAGIIQRGVQSC